MTYNKLIHKYNDHENVVKRLIMHHTKYNTVELFQVLDEPIDFDIKLFESDFKRFLKDEPLQYIMGYEYFLDLKIKVQPGIYIPRPETEMLVNEVLDIIAERFPKGKLTMADVCSGSGAIALGLAHKNNHKVYGLELSKEALLISEENNKTNNCDVEFIQSDIDKYLMDSGIKLDVLVSNPPYIKPKTILPNNVQDYEPHMALFDKEEDGMSFYKHILKNHNITTKENSIIAFEMGYDQKELMETLIKTILPNSDYYFLYDYENHPRSVIINKKTKQGEV